MLSEKDAHSHVVSMLRWMVRTPLAEQVHLFMGMVWWSGWSGHSELVIETPKIGILFEVICAVSGNGSCQYWPFPVIGAKSCNTQKPITSCHTTYISIFSIRAQNSSLREQAFHISIRTYVWLNLNHAQKFRKRMNTKFGEWFWKGIFQITLIDGFRSLDFLISRLSTTMKSEKSILEVMFYKWTIAEPCWTI